MASANPYRFAGYRYDEVTGLYYLLARYYDPEIGRFIRPDDQRNHDGMTGAAANLYAYANNNPVKLVDPSGHDGVNKVVNSLWNTYVYISHKLLGQINNLLGWFGVPSAIYGATSLAARKLLVSLISKFVPFLDVASTVLAGLAAAGFLISKADNNDGVVLRFFRAGDSYLLTGVWGQQ